MSALNLPITSISGVGQKRALLFNKLGIYTVYDLIHHLPRGYIDYSNTSPISKCYIGDRITVKATVFSKQAPIKVRSGLEIFRVTVLDSEQTAATVTIFNNKFAYEKLKIGEKYIFSGKLSGNLLRPEISSPTFIKEGESSNLTPIYPLTKGLTNTIISNTVKRALLLLKNEPNLPISDAMLKKLDAFKTQTPYSDIHFPKSLKASENAKKLFIFEELLCLQLGMAGLKNRAKRRSEFVFSFTDLSDFYNSLPFSPTNAQKKAIFSAINDITSGNCMNRLLQGDVGSGKTLVAAALFYLSAKNGYQASIMAPTEILSLQHYKTLKNMLEPFHIVVEVLTGSTTKKQRERLFEKLKNGEIDILCGTHALIEKSVEFNNLALVITDEQHRFGVKQRAEFIKKGGYPHTLIMSATPIPRSLALTIYGDLDISVLDELPLGRKKIKTYVIDSNKRLRSYNFLRQHINLGRQVYIVCPAVEESELDLASVNEYYDSIKSYLGEFEIELLHGKMKSKQKDEIMSRFRSGEIDILISTTVIEVGIDVPNANIMLIENAERFGLSQLHQLRGRVGRGEFESFCILVSDSKSENAKERLSIMQKHSDGFEISNYDLKLRGPGNFFGECQHGLPPLKIADLLSDSKMLETVRKCASEILETDPRLNLEEHKELKQSVNSLFKKLSFQKSN